MTIMRQHEATAATTIPRIAYVSNIHFPKPKTKFKNECNASLTIEIWSLKLVMCGVYMET